MLTASWVLALALVQAIDAGGATPPAAPAAPAPAATASPLRRPMVERFHLFSLTALPPPALDLSGLPEEKRMFHQAGDPDSLFTLGEATPGG